MSLALTDVLVGTAGATLMDTTNSMPAHRPVMLVKGMRQKRPTKSARNTEIMAELKLSPVLVSYRAFDVEVARVKAERHTAKPKTSRKSQAELPLV